MPPRIDALLAAAAQPGLGVLVGDSVPAYHERAAFHWTLRKRPYQPTLGVFLRQAGQWVFMAELPVGRALTGSGSVLIVTEMSSAMPGRIDYGQPAEGQAFMWDERLVAQGKPAAITGQIFFTVPAIA